MITPYDVDRERPRLIRIAYRMLGSLADAEDVVGDVAVESLRAVESENPAGWLTTVTVRRSLDLLRRRQRERQTYLGPWLPEPRVTAVTDLPADAGDREAELSIGFLHLAETLTPPQRAVIILRSLGYEHSEIADILQMSTAASRQHEHRARIRLDAAAAEIDHPAGDHTRMHRREARQLLGRFLAAARRGDLDRLLRTLHDDVVGYSDGGGRVRAARNPITGPLKLARFVLGVTRRNPDTVVETVLINGRPGICVVLAGNRHLITLEARDGRIHRFYDISNPDKLTTSVASAPTGS